MGLKKKCSVMLSMLMLLPNIAYANDLNSTVSLNKEISLINADSTERVGEERVISAPMLATIATLAVASGIPLSSDDDIYDIGRLFYDYVERNKDLNWGSVKTTFESAKVLNDTILINSGILDITRGFFDSKFKNNNSDISFTYNGSLPYFQDFQSVLKYSSSHYDFIASDYYGKSFKSQGLDFKLKAVYDTASIPYSLYDVYIGNQRLFDFTMYGGSSIYLSRKYTLYTYKYSATEKRVGIIRDGDTQNASTYIKNDYFLRIFGGVGTLPYNGGYNWDTNVEDKKEGNGDLPLPIPGNLGDLVGKNPSDVWDKNYENGLVGDGDIVIPAVEGASISVDTSTTFSSEGTYKTPVILNQEATVLDVTVPLSLPVHIDGSGAVTVADNIEIVNNSIAPVKLSSVSIAPKDGWSMVSYDKDFSGSRVGLKEFGFELDGYDLIPNTALTLSDKVVNGGDNLNLIYNANVSPQKEAITDDTVADVVFTIDWD